MEGKPENMEITQDMIDVATQEEGAILAQMPQVLMAQNEVLNQRVVLLRALVNEQERVLNEKEQELETLRGDEKSSSEEG